jgi:NADPH:quinone reductase-like Zn-dependent oxidoreductase
MKAVLIYKYGGPEELKYTETEKPQINPDEVLVKVIATSINPIDWKVRKGDHGQGRKLPAILGWDLSGIIEQVGEEVKDYKAGDEVYARPDTTRNGTYAEYVAVRAKEIYFKPKTLDHIKAATVPLAGLTAWQGVFDHGKLQAGQKILIHGASGGVGTFAVQFAKWKGAYVIGTASANNIEFLKELGVDEVIDYKKEHFEEKLKDIDVVFDLIGGETQTKSIKVLKHGGILVSTVGIKDKEALKGKEIEGVQYMAQSTPADLKQIAALIDEGKIKPVITKTLPLKDIAEAHKLSEEGHTKGKIAITVAE